MSMKKIGQLTRRQESAIAALLSCPTVEAAASAAGVAYSTLRGWLSNDPAFIAAYRQARRQVVEQAIGSVQATTADAVAALKRNLTCGKPGDEVRAALGILDRAIAGVELVDLAERMEQLEAQVDAAGAMSRRNADEGKL